MMPKLFPKDTFSSIKLLLTLLLLLLFLTFWKKHLDAIRNLTVEEPIKTTVELKIPDSLEFKKRIFLTIPDEGREYTELIKNRAVKFKKLWPTLEGCTHLEVTLARNHTYKPCGLVSSPCSGNTWSRFIIESMTGVATGSMYNDQKLVEGGFIGETALPTCGCTIVQKSHFKTPRKFPFRLFNSRYLVLIRNPYKQVVSIMNWGTGGNHLNIGRNFSIRGWNNVARKWLTVWEKQNTEWIKSMKNGIVVHYEEIQHGMRKQAKRILDYLGVPFIEERYECLKKRDFTKFKRKGTDSQIPFLREAYTKELHQTFDASIDRVNKLLIKVGHAPIPYHLYTYYNETIQR